jgi:hypothetical protein
MKKSDKQQAELLEIHGLLMKAGFSKVEIERHSKSSGYQWKVTVTKELTDKAGTTRNALIDLHFNLWGDPIAQAGFIAFIADKNFTALLNKGIPPEEKNN